jgi:hypothetical protein
MNSSNVAMVVTSMTSITVDDAGEYAYVGVNAVSGGAVWKIRVSDSVVVASVNLTVTRSSPVLRVSFITQEANQKQTKKTKKQKKQKQKQKKRKKEKEK